MGYVWAENTLEVMAVVCGGLFFLGIALRGARAARRAWGEQPRDTIPVKLWKAAMAFIIAAALLEEPREVGEGGGRAEAGGVNAAQPGRQG